MYITETVTALAVLYSMPHILINGEAAHNTGKYKIKQLRTKKP